MANINFSIDSDLSAEHVLAVATNFSEERPRYWPSIDAQVYRVHAQSSTTADITEGSAIFGGIWAREAYDWTEPNTVRATVQESNAFQPGGTWELRVTPRPDGGSHIEVRNHRRARGLKGRLVGIMLTVMGTKVLPRQLQKTLEISSSIAPARVA
ncbi:MAG: SRPBCC family protein [Candidatus Dormibacteria bacterium]